MLLFDRNADTVDELRDLKIPGKPEETAPAGGAAGAAGGADGGAGAAGGAGGAEGGADASGGAGGAGGAGAGGDAGAAGDPGAMAGAPALTSEPRFIELSDVAEVKEVKTAPTIRHTDSQRSTTVSVTPAGDDLGTVSADVQSALNDVDIPDSVSVDTGGATQEQNEAFSQLGLAMLAAILIVFVIMVATFKSLLQPLILLVSIPFAATGSIALSLLTDTPLGSTSMIGLLMLIGIVVTNAIVLIDLINHFRARGVDLRGGDRPRCPVALSSDPDDRGSHDLRARADGAGSRPAGGVFISKPLAIVVIGGLISSTLLTLILVPVLYLLLEGAKERRAEKKHVKNMARGQVLDVAEARAGQRSDATDRARSGTQADTTAEAGSVAVAERDESASSATDAASATDGSASDASPERRDTGDEPKH